MNEARWSEVEALFHATIDRPEAEREAFVHDRCATDLALAREVLSLLQADSSADPRLTGLTGAPLPRSVSSDRVASEGRQFGSYTLLHKLGEGGMGTVYLGARADGAYQRQVAIKLLDLSPYLAAAAERFRVERQILADLDHPAIARLLDGGTSPEGTPYLVMEHVEGVPIDRYCEGERLSIEGRVRLVCEVCAAVQHAHRKLIVHRDIKPSNILVTADGRSKLLDFGIAKLLNPEGTPAGERTGARMRPLTPAYASPEQLRGEPVSTASDVYSLGLLLYLLLTGRPPDRPDSRVPSDSDDPLRHWQPVKPSQAVMELARQGAGAPSPSPAREARARGRRLTGDLDAIVLKALRHDPEERYGTVEHLARDLRRHLEGRPVSARPPTLGYRLSRLAFRHRVAVAIGSILVSALLAASLAALFFARRATDERDRVAAEKVRAEKVADLLLDVFDVAGEVGASVTARELLDQRAEDFRARLDVDPQTEAALLATLGTAYRKLGLYERGLPLLEQSLALRRQLLPVSQRDVGESALQLAALYLDMGLFEAAEALLVEALGIFTRAGPDALPRRLESRELLALVYELQGRLEDAEAALLEILPARRALHGPRHPRVAATLHQLAGVVESRGDLPGAEALYREVVELDRQLAPADPERAPTLKNLGLLLRARGDLSAAEALYREALALEVPVLGADHPRALVTRGFLGLLQAERGDPEGAARSLETVLAARRRVYGDAHPRVAETLHSLGRIHLQLGEEARAEARLRESVEIARATLPASAPGRAYPLAALGRLLLDAGRPSEAEPLLVEAREIRRHALPADHPLLAWTSVEVARCAALLDRTGEARAGLAAGLRALEPLWGGPWDDEIELARRWLAELGSEVPASSGS